METHFHSLRIPSITTTLLLHACRTNNTTLTATIPVLIATSLAQLLPPSLCESFESCIPVSLRRWLPEPYADMQDMGVFIDALSLSYSRTDIVSSSGFSWDEARRARAGIGEYLLTAGRKVNVASLQDVPDMKEMFLAKVGCERGSSFDILNIGTALECECEVWKEEGWKMGGMVFNRGAFASGSAFSTGLVTGMDGCLVLGFVWQVGVVEEELMSGMIEKVREGIERLANESSNS